MPEDIHSANKAMVNSFGSRVTVTVPAVICNDLVATVADRYTQAKRHQWGSVTELAWVLTLLKDTNLRFPAWWAVFSSEAARAGSLPGAVMCLVGFVLQICVAIAFALHSNSGNNSVLPSNAAFALGVIGAGAVLQWAWFWIAEFTWWNTVLRKLPIERPTYFRWILIVVAMPVANVVNIILFFILPTFHALYHASFVSYSLKYTVAPKGDYACLQQLSAPQSV
mmetsp:Transcript_62881/g.182420  ORF Transcript_62881/g.182420 Transcript_62881/m.182420 type:complete len:224 (-) Transcript_62881:336-1007(-)